MTSHHNATTKHWQGAMLAEQLEVGVLWWGSGYGLYPNTLAIPWLPKCSGQQCFLTKVGEGNLSLARRKYAEDWL